MERFATRLGADKKQLGAISFALLNFAKPSHTGDTNHGHLLAVRAAHVAFQHLCALLRKMHVVSLTKRSLREL